MGIVDLRVFVMLFRGAMECLSKPELDQIEMGF
jgi:hypothetical protein